MQEDLKSRIERLKKRRFPYKNNEGKWGFTDVFGKVIEPAHLDKIDNNPYKVKGAKEMDTMNPLSCRELITRYTDFNLPINNRLTDKQRDNLWEISKKTWPRINDEKETVSDFGDYSFIREDLGKRDIDLSHIIKYGLKRQKQSLECSYDNIYPFKEERARIFKSTIVEQFPLHGMTWTGIGFIYEFEDIKNVLDWNAPEFSSEEIMERGEYGFIDKNGDEVIPCQYDDARDFCEGLAAVCDGRWGYIDKDNNIIIPLDFEWADDFVDGFARVLLAGNFYIIDKEGFCYESFFELECGLGTKFYLEETSI